MQIEQNFPQSTKAIICKIPYLQARNLYERQRNCGTSTPGIVTASIFELEHKLEWDRVALRAVACLAGQREVSRRGCQRPSVGRAARQTPPSVRSNTDAILGPQYGAAHRSVNHPSELDYHGRYLARLKRQSRFQLVKIQFDCWWRASLCSWRINFKGLDGKSSAVEDRDAEEGRLTGVDCQRAGQYCHTIADLKLTSDTYLSINVRVKWLIYWLIN